jgi:hypothetical protein
MVHCRVATASSFVGEVFEYLYAVTVKITVFCRIDWLACQGKFFMNRPLDVENDKLALDLSCLLCSW